MSVSSKELQKDMTRLGLKVANPDPSSLPDTVKDTARTVNKYLERR